jgi:2'-5' RNA ligase
MVVGDFGVFPSPDYISVVWAGVREGGPELTRLHEAVERETTALGFDPADHAFTPHVTLARMDDARGKEAVQRVVREADPTVGGYDVTEVRLTESRLTDDGPVYETVARFPLG